MRRPTARRWRQLGPAERRACDRDRRVSVALDSSTICFVSFQQTTTWAFSPFASLILLPPTSTFTL